MAHTSGPWRADVSFVNGPRDYGYDAATGEFSSIAQAFGRDAEANARLIAAAPDLLEALRLLVGMVRASASSYTEHPDFHLALAAIAKAEGR